MPTTRDDSQRIIAALRQERDAALVRQDELTELLVQRNREYDEQTAHRSATAEILRVINESAGDLMPVFDAIVEKAIRLCAPAMGALSPFDGEKFQFVVMRGYPQPYVDHMAGGWRSTPGGNSERLMREGGFVHIADIVADPTYGVSANYQAMHRLAGTRTLLLVPLRTETASLGLFTLSRRTVHPFTPREIELVRDFAAQAVIAMENARLLREQREALEQQTATAEVLQVINASPGDLMAVFGVIVEKAIRLCAPAMGALSPFDGEKFAIAVPRGYPQPYIDRYKDGWRPTPGGASERLMREGGIVHIADVVADPAYETSSHYRAMHELAGTRTMLLVPLRTETASLGLFTISRREVRPFTSREIDLVRNFAAQAVIAMENARLLGELRTSLETTRTALRELKTAQANLIQAEKMASLGQLTAGIAHEIKNPLNFVNNFAILCVDLLAELKETLARAAPLLNDSERAEIDDVVEILSGNLEKINHHGQRADGIVKAMLEHSRGASVERRAVDINQLTEEALNLAFHGARAADQSFSVILERDYGADIAPIAVNPQDMTRVLLNLFANGFYAANQRAKDGQDANFQPVLRVTTRATSDAVDIRVRDNGTGIPAEIRDKLFQPFFTTKPSGQGTGLGLSITYDIVTKQHGGTIKVDSDVGAFTEFTVTLPRQMFAADPLGEL